MSNRPRGRTPAPRRVASGPSHSPFLVVLSAPSGAGKTSICREVVRRDSGLFYSVSATTRPRRKGEVSGRSYHFYTKQQFMATVRRDGFLEHAQVYDHQYGTPRAPVLNQLRQGRDVMADLDLQGVRSCRRALPGTVSIFVTAPDAGELARRLRGRGTDDPEALARREADCAQELAAIPEYDYLVVNDKLKQAVSDVMAIVRAERLRTARMSPTALSRSLRPETGGK